MEPLGAFQLYVDNGTADKNVRRGVTDSLMPGYNFATTCREVDKRPRRTKMYDVRQHDMQIDFFSF